MDLVSDMAAAADAADAADAAAAIPILYSSVELQVFGKMHPLLSILPARRAPPWPPYPGESSWRVSHFVDLDTAQAYCALLVLLHLVHVCGLRRQCGATLAGFSYAAAVWPCVCGSSRHRRDRAQRIGSLGMLCEAVSCTTTKAQVGARK